MAVAPEEFATRSGIPLYLVEFREKQNVMLLEAILDLQELGERVRFTQKEAARLAKCGLQTVKDAMRDGTLKTGTSRWITRPQLAEWLGYDPIDFRREEVRKLQRQSTELARMIEELYPEPDSDHAKPMLNPSIPVSNSESAA